ncbi:cytochrome P450 [Phytohalomonas tamaricis]|uniref:cytochrome P450 n=1 Tax=Phytohalomonas tamaricis TaxID=2081032 RepID=UPI000D0B9101|nr:cytochrome P450 [Phytohalomonas tamaricis]
MPQIPEEKSLESTPHMLREGYLFISNHCHQHQADLFQARLLFEKTLLMRGEEAARLFYNADYCKREGAAPVRLQKTLFGVGGVQALDGELHHVRKQMFMSLMTPEGIDRLVTLTRQVWNDYLDRWTAMDRVVLFEESKEILCRAVCAWAGVPLAEEDVRQRTEDLNAMIEGASAIGPQHWHARLGRKRAEQWIGALIEQVRDGELSVAEGSALHTVATHHDANGEKLDTHVAAVEVLNLLRPTVAVSRYITFVAHALHEHGHCLAPLQGEHRDEYAEWFVQEVRRVYPFFPFAAARLRDDVDWRGYRLPKDTRVLLDLYGTNHDARLWDDPEAFRPERFHGWEGNPYSLIPQGGGDHYANHRCPGEWITIALMKMTLNLLTNSMEYDVPPQDLSISLTKIPALPESGFVISNVRHVPLTPMG